MSKETEREAFERVISCSSSEVNKRNLVRAPEGFYIEDRIDALWDGWQMRASGAAGERAAPVAWMKRTNVSADWDAFNFSANPEPGFDIPLYAAAPPFLDAQASRELPERPKPDYWVAEEPKRHGMHPAYANEQNVRKYGGEGLWRYAFNAETLDAYARAALALQESGTSPSAQR